VFGGMIASTFLAVFFVPVFFVVIQSLEEMWMNRGGRKRGPALSPSPPASHPLPPPPKHELAKT
jgi:HAE1 family hydrophobic/amphiphilic exporter-1